MWPEIKARLKKEPPPAHQNVACENCETEFSGHYCPNCGQSVRDYDRPFTFIFYNFLGDFFAFDTRFFRTLAALIVRPGFLTKEYFKGRRVRYAPPFRIFIFVSFVLFLLLQIYTNRGLTTVLDSEFVATDSASVHNLDSLITIMNSSVDPEDKEELDSLLKQTGVIIDTSAVRQAEDNFHLDLEGFRDTRGLRKNLNKLADSLEVKLEKEANPQKRLKLREYIGLCRSPENAVAKILEYISWAFFLLLPIFAILLKLVYIRRKQNYMRHLVFSIHIHSFIYIVLIFIVALYLLFEGHLKTITSILILSVPMYFIIAMKNFYGQSIGKVVLKFFTVSFLYNIIFFMVLTAAILNALGLV